MKSQIVNTLWVFAFIISCSIGAASAAGAPDPVPTAEGVMESLTTIGEPRFELSSDSVMQDEVIEIALSGLDPWARVTLRLTTEINGMEFVSSADFHADVKGRVDVTSQVPVVGSYQGADAMGLFWSMLAEPAEDNAKTHARPDPWEIQPPQQYELTALQGDEEVASASLERVIDGAGVRIRRLNEGRLRGVLYLPPGDGPHPALLAVTGSGGGYYSHATAAALAHRGFAVLGMAYFNAPDLPEQLENIPLEYFEEALEWLAAVPEVDSNRIGVIGASRGGELSLLLGSRFPQIRVVVSMVPSHVVWPGCCTAEAFSNPGWTWKGEPLAAMPMSETAWRAREYWADIGGEDWLGFYWINLGNTGAEAAAVIPAEKINGPVLLISAGDDRIWPSTYMADRVMERLEAHNFPHTHIHLRYDDSGHAAGSLPYGPKAGRVSVYHSVGKVQIGLGGTAESLARSSEDSWKIILQFLGEHLR